MAVPLVLVSIQNTDLEYFESMFRQQAPQERSHRDQMEQMAFFLRACLGSEMENSGGER